MQQTLPNFCKCFGPGKNTNQNGFAPATPQTVNPCRCTPNACPPDDKFLLICCNECVVNGPKECGKPAPTPACQVSCAQPEVQQCTCCTCRRCPICLIRNLCRETWDAYQKEKTVPERYSLFEGGPSLTTDLLQAKPKSPSEFSSTERGRQLLGQVDKGARKSEREHIEEERKATKRVIKKDKYKDSDEDIGIKGKKKRKQKAEISEDEIENTSKRAGKSKKGSKKQTTQDSSTDKNKSSKSTKGRRKVPEDSDEEVPKGGKAKGSKKGGGKNSKAVDDDEDDGLLQSKKAKQQKKATKGKSKMVEDSDDEAPSKAKGKKGKSGQDEGKGKGSKAKGKLKDVKSKDTFRDGDKARGKDKAKGGRGDRIADIDSEDSDMRVDKRGKKVGKGQAKSILRQKDEGTLSAKGKRNQKFSSQRKDVRDDSDWGLKDYHSSDESLIDKSYKERIAKLNALGRKLNTSDYMRLRLEQRDLKGLDCRSRMPTICCTPCRPCQISSPCGADPCACVPNNCCCPSPYF